MVAYVSSIKEVLESVCDSEFEGGVTFVVCLVRFDEPIDLVAYSPVVLLVGVVERI